MCIMRLKMVMPLFDLSSVASRLIQHHHSWNSNTKSRVIEYLCLRCGLQPRSCVSTQLGRGDRSASQGDRVGEFDDFGEIELVL